MVPGSSANFAAIVGLPRVSFLIIKSSALSLASRKLFADLCSAALVPFQVLDRIVDALDGFFKAFVTASLQVHLSGSELGLQGLNLRIFAGRSALQRIGDLGLGQGNRVALLPLGQLQPPVWCCVLDETNRTDGFLPRLRRKPQP